jgi:dTDP-glucose 4,6-dehydratase
LRDIEENENYIFEQGNIADRDNNIRILKDHKIDKIVNFAAESHNGRSMTEPDIFFRTNVLGTQMLLDAAKEVGIERFHHISTCEVFGELELDEDRKFLEDDPFLPRTPYNASKASANHVVMAYYYTFGQPVTISHCANNYGPYQFPEKLIPRFTINASKDLELPLFKSSENKREWLHTEDHARAIDLILEKGKDGKAYNIGSGVEKSVEEIADIILDFFDQPQSLKTYVEDRPGHDKRYLLDTSRIRNELGWTPQVPFAEGMKDTMNWYLENEDWWKPLLDKGYVEEYKKL